MAGLAADLINDALETIRVLVCDFGEHLSVEANVLLAQHAHEAAEGQIVLMQCRVEANIEVAAEVLLLLPAVVELVGAGMHDRLATLALFR